MESPVFKGDGSVAVPSFVLPPSQYMSPEAARFLMMRASRPSASSMFAADTVEALRAANERMLAPLMEPMRAQYPVEVVADVIGGVAVDVITPVGGEAKACRVLINLHGGGFVMGEGVCGLLESIPIAALGKFRVVSVHYRHAPEHQFPAGSIDAASVYRELLGQHAPTDIGMFGCSAGGVLTAQATAWLLKEGLPAPGAIALLSAGAERGHVGDSHYYAAYADGSFPPPADGKPVPIPFSTYFDDVDPRDPLVSPAFHPELLARFPPTLLITGTRAHDLSAAAFTHSALRKAGAQSELFVGDGLGHGYMMNPFTPESRDSYRFTVDFFERHLGAGQ